MKKKERDTFEELFQSKLMHLEVDTERDDWHLIAEHLPEKKISSRKYLYWGTSVAAAALLLFFIGTLFISLPVEDTLVEVNKKETLLDLESTVYSVIDDSSKTMLAVVSKQPIKNKEEKISNNLSRKGRTPIEHLTIASFDESVETGLIKTKEEPVRSVDTFLKKEEYLHLVVKKEKVKRWSFGMGGGSVTMGSANVLSSSIFKSTFESGPSLLRLNSSYYQGEVSKTNVRHKYPVSVGVGVNYRLNSRFALQSGLNYSFLSSEWEKYAVYREEVKQKLHFVGIPLSLSYKIAKWKDFQFYTAAGIMVEMNVAGTQKSKIFAGDELVGKHSERVRMKELLCSLNACVGVDYPLYRFLSLYAEVGVDYYIDNGSSIETIRSEKPFNVNLQAGFRFGF